jgi:hypothetical protein
MKWEDGGSEGDVRFRCAELLGKLGRMRAELYARRCPDWANNRDDAEALFFEDLRSGDVPRAAVALSYIVFETADAAAIRESLFFAFNAYTDENIRSMVLMQLSDAKLNEYRLEINCYLARLVLDLNYEDSIREAAYMGLLVGEELLEFTNARTLETFTSLVDYTKLSTMLSLCEE